MTMPEAIPQLSNSVTDTGTEPTVTRIGVVTGVGPGSNLTVQISGSNVLINAAYLITYQPVLGDVVAVTRQGAAWLCHGSFSLFNPGNPVLNPSFENSPAGSPTTPSDWTLFHDPASTAASVSEITSSSGSRDGSQFWDIAVSATGNSFDTLASSPIPVATGQVWTAAAWNNAARTAVSVTTTSVLRLGWYASDADPIGTTIATNDVATRQCITVTALNSQDWVLLREGANAAGFTVPGGANFLRVLLANVITNTVGNVGVNTWDAVSARRVK